MTATTSIATLLPTHINNLTGGRTEQPHTRTPICISGATTQPWTVLTAHLVTGLARAVNEGRSSGASGARDLEDTDRVEVCVWGGGGGYVRKGETNDTPTLLFNVCCLSSMLKKTRVATNVPARPGCWSGRNQRARTPPPTPHIARAWRLPGTRGS